MLRYLLIVRLYCVLRLFSLFLPLKQQQQKQFVHVTWPGLALFVHLLPWPVQDVGIWSLCLRNESPEMGSGDFFSNAPLGAKQCRVWWTWVIKTYTSSFIHRLALTTRTAELLEICDIKFCGLCFFAFTSALKFTKFFHLLPVSLVSRGMPWLLRDGSAGREIDPWSLRGMEWEIYPHLHGNACIR